MKARRNLTHYKVNQRQNFSEPLLQSFIVLAKYCINCSDNFEEVITNLANKVEEIFGDNWSVVAYTSIDTEYFLTGIRIIEVNFNGLILVAFQSDYDY